MSISDVYGVPTFYVCTECGDATPVNEGLPDGWSMRWEKGAWYLYCPCVYKQKVNYPQYWNESVTTGYTMNNATVTWNAPKPTHKNANQEHLDKILDDIEEEKKERIKRWTTWEEMKNHRHTEPCESCQAYLETQKEKARIRRELHGFGKGNKEEK